MTPHPLRAKVLVRRYCFADEVNLTSGNYGDTPERKTFARRVTSPRRCVIILVPPEKKDRDPRVHPVQISSAETSIRQLLANGKSKAALDAAKDFHKAQKTPASEALLIEAYAARIRALFDQNLALEAKSLMDLVRERFPAAKALLDGITAAQSLRSGSLDELLKPLNDPALDAERRAGIERAIRERVSDPSALAGCTALPPEHPLRTAAAAIARCFQAVTSGFVTDEQLELPEISRRSPLAPWKLMIRAIAAFHRREDEKCREHLDAIDAESAPARLVPAMRVMLGGKGAGELAPAAAALAARFRGDAGPLKSALAAVDRAFREEEDEGRVFKAVRTMVQEARKIAPELLEDLKRLVYTHGWVADIQIERLIAAMDGPPRRCAALARLMARGMESSEEDEHYAIAAGYWDQFRQEAVNERWFPPRGVEEAAVYLHMAEVLLKTPPDLLKEAQRGLRADPRLFDPGEPLPDLYYLYPEKIFERACVLDPHSEAFAKWQRWAAQQSVSKGEAVTKAWNKALPGDIEPVLYLMQRAEEKKTFPAALGFLATAERIDGVHPAVRAARLRLLARSVLSHLQKKKPAPAEKALAQMAALPQVQQGDRPAFLAALRCMIAQQRGDAAVEAEARAEMARVLGGDLAGDLLLSNLNVEARRPVTRFPPVKTLPAPVRAGLPLAVARITALIKEFRFAQFGLQEDYVEELKAQMRDVPAALETAHLETLAEMGTRLRADEMAYFAAGAGLGRGEATDARFLLLRARSLPAGFATRVDACAAAAAALGRLHGDADVVGKAVELTRNPFGPDKAVSFTPEQAREVVQREKMANKYPTNRDSGPSYRDLLPDDICQCEDCRRRRGEIGGPSDNEGLDESEMRRIFDEHAPKGMPREARDMMFDLMKIALEEGISPEEILANLEDVPGGGGNRKKGRRK